MPAPSRLILPPARERTRSGSLPEMGEEAAGWGWRGLEVIFLVVGCQGPGSTAGPKEWKGVKQRKGLMASRRGRMRSEGKGEAEGDCECQLRDHVRRGRASSSSSASLEAGVDVLLENHMHKQH